MTRTWTGKTGVSCARATTRSTGPHPWSRTSAGTSSKSHHRCIGRSLHHFHAKQRNIPSPHVPVWLCPRHPHVPSNSPDVLRFGASTPSNSELRPRAAPHDDLPHPPKHGAPLPFALSRFRHPNTHTHICTHSCRTCKAAKFKQGSTRCAAASCDKILKKINIGTRTKAERDYQVRRRGQELPTSCLCLPGLHVLPVRAHGVGSLHMSMRRPFLPATSRFHAARKASTLTTHHMDTPHTHTPHTHITHTPITHASLHTHPGRPTRPTHTYAGSVRQRSGRIWWT